jgi:hypothetical protein
MLCRPSSCEALVDVMWELMALMLELYVSTFLAL